MTAIITEKEMQKELIREAAMQYYQTHRYGNYSKFRDEGGYLNEPEVKAAIFFANEYFDAYKDIMESNDIKVEFVRELFVLSINEAAGERAKVISLGIIENHI